MTFTIDEETTRKLTNVLLGPNEQLTNVVFHVRDNGAAEVWFHFREKFPDGDYSAPAYLVYDLREKQAITPSCSEEGGNDF